MMRVWVIVLFVLGSGSLTGCSYLGDKAGRGVNRAEWRVDQGVNRSIDRAVDNVFQ